MGIRGGAAVPFVFVTGEIIKMSDRPKPLVLGILDGSGHSPDTGCKAIAAQTRCHEAFDDSVAYLPAHIKNGSGKVRSNSNMKQLSPGETDEYAYAICLLNGSRMRLIADHGNIHPTHDEEAGQPHADRTANPVHPAPIYDDRPRAMGLPLSGPASAMRGIFGGSRLVETTGRPLPAAY